MLISRLLRPSILTFAMSAPQVNRPPPTGPKPPRNNRNASNKFRPRPKPKAANPSSTAAPTQEAPALAPQPPTALAHATTIRFTDIPGLDPRLSKTIPYEFCTEVQAATLPDILQGHDVLAQAKTGTGKTMGFLVPSIQKLLASPKQPQGTSVLVLSPTRELAQQIAVEAGKLITHFPTIGVQCVVGGTNIKTDIKNLTGKRADVLIATPGRALDLLENSDLKGQLSGLNTLVLDEADRLLDQGFRRELTKIFDHLPDRRAVPRQSLLFSATMPQQVQSIASIALKPGHKFISTLQEEDQNVHEHVRQELIVVPQQDVIPATLAALQSEAAKTPNFKVMVFLPTARSTALFASVFSKLNEFPVWEIHSRMTQPKRTSTTEAFKAASKGVLFSSDVTARGIDIKNVTAVIQTGLPSSAEQYIHRLGRTARAGAEGHGILILADYEQFFLRDKTIRDLTLHPISPDVSQLRAKIDRAMDQVDAQSKEQTYGAWLGYYNTSIKSLKWTPAELVAKANEFASVTLRYGPQPPGLPAKTVGKMHLRGTPGLRIVKDLPRGGSQPSSAATSAPQSGRTTPNGKRQRQFSSGAPPRKGPGHRFGGPGGPGQKQSGGQPGSRQH